MLCFICYFNRIKDRRGSENKMGSKPAAAMGACIGTGTLLGRELSRGRNQDNIFHGCILSETYGESKEEKSLYSHERQNFDQ